MQVDIKPGLTEEEEKALRKKLGFSDDPVSFNEELLTKALKHPKVEQVRVFKLKKGQVVEIEGDKYKVTAVRPNGKITIRALKK